MKNGLSVGIVGLGSYAPDKKLTNADLEKMVDTSDEWIRTRTGILERRIVTDEVSSSDLAISATRRALDDAGITPDEIDLIICSTATPDMMFPATACIVQDAIGANNAGAFDMEIGCSGFIYGLTVGSQFVKNGMYRTVLVIGTECLTKIVNWEDRRTCVLFGDGAGAAVLQPLKRGKGFMGFELGSRGSGAELLKLPAGGSRKPASFETVANKEHCIYMDGHEVYKFAVVIMGEAAVKALERAGLKSEDVDYFIPHQANIRIIKAAAKRLNLDMDRVIVNVDRYGNTSCASVPLALDEARREGKIKDGDILVFVAFGAGLSWAAAVMEWGGEPLKTGV
ncbi:MAG: ketoacyl-ACP synthase III [Candidatus Eremiobacteraeota bacterium]|nr:ketoacyl-ACP synthase III [Candidatus Eremiobacteraeota bacterium]